MYAKVVAAPDGDVKDAMRPSGLVATRVMAPEESVTDDRWPAAYPTRVLSPFRSATEVSEPPASKATIVFLRRVNVHVPSPA